MKPSKRLICFNSSFEQFFFYLRNEYKKNGLICNPLRCVYIFCCFADGKWKGNHLYSGRTWSSFVCGVCGFCYWEITALAVTRPNCITSWFILGVRNHCLRQIGSLHTDVFELCRFYCCCFKYLHLLCWIYSQTAISSVCTNTRFHLQSLI
jgi:hypothetical protein